MFGFVREGMGNAAIAEVGGDASRKMKTCEFRQAPMEARVGEEGAVFPLL